MTPVILGAIEMRKRTKLEGLQVFLASLRWHNPTIRVVLFNRSPEHDQLTALLRRYDVEAIDARVFDQTHGIPPVEIEIARFMEYRAWLVEHRSSAVILTDVLDVVWQHDPATALLQHSLSFYEENQIVGACPYNRKWLREVFPAAYLEFLAKPIVCCGVIIGGPDAIRDYLNWYTTAFLERGAENVRRGFDSAVANGYAALRVPGAFVLPYPNTECVHLGYADPTTVTYEDNKVRVNGMTPVIAHQYNRHPEVLKGLYDRWI